MSRAQLGRIERAELSDLALEQSVAPLWRSGFVSAPGSIQTVMRSATRRSAGWLDRFRMILGPGAAWATEVPLPISGDRRAWDALIGPERQACRM
jgi:hypothetical protein